MGTGSPRVSSSQTPASELGRQWVLIEITEPLLSAGTPYRRKRCLNPVAQGAGGVFLWGALLRGLKKLGRLLWQQAAPLTSSIALLPSCTTLLTQASVRRAGHLVRYTDRCLSHPSAALQDTFEIITKQIALRSKQLLRGSAAHEDVHFLHIAIQLRPAKAAQFAGDALK